jgi:hypothetical protein
MFFNTSFEPVEACIAFVPTNRFLFGATLS